MKPSQFKKLATPRDFKEESNLDDITKLIKNGRAIASPFLDVLFDPKGKKPAIVKSHEGRTRMEAIYNLYGDIPVLVHIFPSNGLRARNITPQMIDSFKALAIPQKKTKKLEGPHFIEVKANIMKVSDKVKAVATLNHSSMFNNGHYDNELKLMFTDVPAGKCDAFLEVLRDYKSYGVKYNRVRTSSDQDTLYNVLVKIRGTSGSMSIQLLNKIKTKIDARFKNFFSKYKKTGS